MKKTITIVGIIITFFIVYFLQANFFSWFTIAKIKPNLFIILLAFVGYLGEYFDKNFSKESRFTIILMVFGSTVLYEICLYLFYIFRMGLQIEIYAFLKILLVEAIYNILIVIIIYPLIQKVGYAIENTFKTKNILTRYF